MPATTEVSYLNTLASLDEASGDLRIIAINKNLDKPTQISFFVSGFTATGEGRVQLLSGPSPDSNTGTQIIASTGDNIFAPQTVYAPNGRFTAGSENEVKIQTSPVTMFWQLSSL